MLTARRAATPGRSRCMAYNNLIKRAQPRHRVDHGGADLHRAWRSSPSSSSRSSARPHRVRTREALMVAWEPSRRAAKSAWGLVDILVLVFALVPVLWIAVAVVQDPRRRSPTGTSSRGSGPGRTTRTSSAPTSSSSAALVNSIGIGADLDGDRGGAGHDGRVRDRPAGVPRQAAADRASRC